MNLTRGTIEVFADVACPFTHVGLRRVVERRTELGRPDPVLRVRAWPLEVVNDGPLDAAFIAEEIATIRENVAPDLFEGFDEANFPSTSLPAFSLAAAAYRHSDAMGEAVSLELRNLLFEEGVNTSDPDVIQKLANQRGLVISDADRASVAADHEEGTERGVIGSPHFFTPVGGFFCPALEVGRDDQNELYVRLDKDGLDKFMDACFAG